MDCKLRAKELADDWMKNNVNLLHDRRPYHLHVLAKMRTRTRRPNWACQEVAVHLATCGLNHSKALHHPHRVRVLSTLTSSIFCLVRSGVEGSTLALSLSFIQQFKFCSIFFAKLHWEAAGRHCGILAVESRGKTNPPKPGSIRIRRGSVRIFEDPWIRGSKKKKKIASPAGMHDVPRPRQLRAWILLDRLRPSATCCAHSLTL